MLVEERQRTIVEHLRTRKALTVEEAAELCGVSHDTIRRDFKKLAEEELAHRTHGGIVLVEEYARDSHLRERQVRNQEEKRRIGAYAASLIQPGETVAIDAGTTAVEAIPFLTEVPNLTILTYSLDVARLAADNREMSCIMLGGLIRENTYSTVGPDALGMLRRFQATTLLLAANAVSPELGLMTPNRMEAEVKQGLINVSQRVILVADSSKIGRRALVSFADFSRIDLFVTDSGADKNSLKQFRELDIGVVTV